MVGDPITLPPIEISQEQCDFYLGNYMRAFNLVEANLEQLFTKLLDAPAQAAHIVFHSGINAQTIREIICSLARLRLVSGQHSQVENLMDGAVKRSFTKRNRIVHGMWQLAIKMAPLKEGEPPVALEAKWQRLYMPSDPDIFRQMHGNPPNQKVIAAHIFTIENMKDAAQDAANLASRISALTTAIHLQPYIPPQPVF